MKTKMICALFFMVSVSERIFARTPSLSCDFSYHGILGKAPKALGVFTDKGSGRSIFAKPGMSIEGCGMRVVSVERNRIVLTRGATRITLRPEGSSSGGSFVANNSYTSRNTKAETLSKEIDDYDDDMNVKSIAGTGYNPGNQPIPRAPQVDDAARAIEEERRTRQYLDSADGIVQDRNLQAPPPPDYFDENGNPVDEDFAIPNY